MKQKSHRCLFNGSSSANQTTYVNGTGTTPYPSLVRHGRKAAWCTPVRMMAPRKKNTSNVHPIPALHNVPTDFLLPQTSPPMAAVPTPTATVSPITGDVHRVHSSFAQ